MERLIFYVAMFCSKKYLVNIHSMDWYREFYSESKKCLHEILPKVPDIGKSIFSFNYKCAPAYIAWYLALKKMGVASHEIDRIIWDINESMVNRIPAFLLHKVCKIYMGSFRRKAGKHIRRQETTGLHPYDWQIAFRNISDNCFEIDIKACGIKKLAADFHAEGMLPGICRMDYLFANRMKNGFERTKTLGDGDECCNCRYFLQGYCDWSPEKGFIDRK